MQDRLAQGLERQLDSAQQGLDRVAARLGQPSHLVTRERAGLKILAQGLTHAAGLALQRQSLELERLAQALPRGRDQALATQERRLTQASMRLDLLDPRLVLQRGYAWLADEQGRALTQAAQAQPGQPLVATLADGQLDVQVLACRP